MEHFLRYYFEQFYLMPRNCLYDRRTRNSVTDYISTIIEGCAKGEGNDIDKTAREAIIGIIRFHEEMRNLNTGICKMGKFHNILYVGVKLCFNWQVKDSATVCSLLEHIYSCEGTFERIIVGALMGKGASHSVAGWKSDFDSQEENMKALVYFIHHTNQAELELAFGIEKKLYKFIDLPLECCGKASPLKVILQLGQPEMLVIFLRFGAAVDGEVEVLLKRLMDFNRVYPYNFIACLRMLLRVVPKIVIDEEVPNCKTQNQKIIERYGDLIEDGLLPMDKCGFFPASLKHLTRCAIRKALWQKFWLPDGIGALPLPDSLKSYVDIMED